MGFEPIRVFVHHYVKRAWAAYHGWPNVSMEFGFREIKIGSGYPNGHKAHESIVHRCHERGPPAAAIPGLLLQDPSVLTEPSRRRQKIYLPTFWTVTEAGTLACKIS